MTRLGRSTIFSPDSQHVAYAAKQGAKWLVVEDGKPGPAYDGIMNGSLIVSPDSQRIAYAAKMAPNVCMVVDGKTAPDYDGVMAVFQFLARIASAWLTRPCRAANGYWWWMGRPVRPMMGLGEASLVFSPDDRHMAYTAKQGRKWLVVVDGKVQSGL